MNFEKIVYNHKDEIVKTFQELLQIPSVLDESDASVGAPFGNNIRKALEYMLAKGKEDGFEVLNDEGNVGIKKNQLVFFAIWMLFLKAIIGRIHHMKQE